MRYFQRKMYEEGINIPLTLHDAFFQYVKIMADGTIAASDVQRFHYNMEWAFRKGLREEPGSELVTIDLKIIGKNIVRNPQINLDIEYADEYIDKRALKTLQRFKHLIEGDLVCTQTKHRPQSLRHSLLFQGLQQSPPSLLHQQ